MGYACQMVQCIRKNDCSLKEKEINTIHKTEYISSQRIGKNYFIPPAQLCSQFPLTVLQKKILSLPLPATIPGQLTRAASQILQQLRASEPPPSFTEHPASALPGALLRWPTVAIRPQKKAFYAIDKRPVKILCIATWFFTFR